MLIGIDLGTTFSAVAHVNNEGKAEVIVNRDGERDILPYRPICAQGISRNKL